MSRAIHVLLICVSYGMVWGNLCFTFQATVNLKRYIVLSKYGYSKNSRGKQRCKGEELNVTEPCEKIT
jgi:hypothetical protein